MTLSIPQIQYVSTIDENFAYEIVIEKTELFTNVMQELQRKSIGEGRDIILSEVEKELDFNKYCEIIWNPLNLNYSNKKILSNIYSELNSCAVNEFYEETENLYAHIVEYMDKIIKTVSYNIDFSLDQDNIGLYKLFKVGIVNDFDCLCEGLIDYILLLKKALNINVVIFINIKQYLNEEEYYELIKRAMYEKIAVYNISGDEKYHLNNEKLFIIDKDECVIDLN